MRRRGMGKDPLEWIGERGEAETVDAERAAEAARQDDSRPALTQQQAPTATTWEGTDLASEELPKYATLIPVTARLTEDQLEYLDAAERRIMRSRRRRRERITKNSIIRAAIELVRRLPWDHRDIADEEELLQRLIEAAQASRPF